MTDDELNRARVLADIPPHLECQLYAEMRGSLLALADEVERLQKAVSDLDGRLWHTEDERNEVWKPLLVAAKSHQWIYDEIGWEEMRRAIVRAEEVLK